MADGILDRDEDLNLNGRLDPGETSDLDRDTDLDGDSDPDELRMGTDPRDSRSLKWRGLASWRFDDDTLTGADGQQPVSAANITFGPGIETRAVDLSSTQGPVILRYRGVEDNGAPNVSLTRGSFRFRLRTFWASNDPDIPSVFRGVGPQEWVTLIETANLAVRIDPNGTNVVVVSRTADGQTITNLQGRIAIESEDVRPSPSNPATSFWYDVLVTYSPEETKLFWGWPSEVTGTGIAPWNGNGSANQFINIGSAPDGTGKFKGILDDVAIYNVPGSLQTNSWKFSAIATANPPALNLVWQPAATNALFDVKKRVWGQTNWTWLSGAIGTNILDTQITSGQRYEYNLNSGFFSTLGVREPYGNTMTASVLGSAIESRGKILLLVDETLEAALQPDLNSFITNLVGDGWSVIRTNVPRHIDDYSSTAAYAPNWFNITNRIAPAIRSQYALHANQLKHILIIGHVTIPYTGDQADDGHTSISQPYGSHRGPWSSDLYYSDVDGLWHDSINIPASDFGYPAYPENHNSPQDGKLDDDYLPPNAQGVRGAEITVARIDFARLPAFSQSEAELLKRYLQKNARYRHKQLTFDASTIGADLFFPFPGTIAADRMAAEMASKLEVLKPAAHGDVFATGSSFIIGLQSSPGYVGRISDGRPQQKQTTDFAAGLVDPACAFYLIRSSWMQDWNLENNFMRAMLTGANGGLAAGWFTTLGAWRFDPLGAGLELGSGWRDVVNRPLNVLTLRQSDRTTQILGDSTLRFPVLAPPSGFTGARVNGMVNLSWTASPEPGCAYNIYRASNGIFTEFVRLNSAPLTGTTFSEPPVSRGSKLYMLRAAKVTRLVPALSSI